MVRVGEQMVPMKEYLLIFFIKIFFSEEKGKEVLFPNHNGYVLMVKYRKPKDLNNFQTTLIKPVSKTF